MDDAGHAAPLRAVRRLRARGARDAPRQLVEEYPGLRVHGVVGDFERHLDRAARRRGGPRLVAFLGGTIGNFPPGSRAALPARRWRRLLRPGRPPAARHRPRQGPGGARGRLRRRAGRDGGVQPQRPARHQPRARRRLRPRRLRARRVLRPRARVDRDAPARRARQHVHVGALGLRRRRSPPREELRTEISAKFTPRAAARATSPRRAWSSSRSSPTPTGCSRCRCRAPAAIGSARMQIENAGALVVGGASGLGEATVAAAARARRRRDDRRRQRRAGPGARRRARRSSFVGLRRARGGRRSQAAVDGRGRGRRRPADRGLLRRHRLGAEGRRLARARTRSSPFEIDHRAST